MRQKQLILLKHTDHPEVGHLYEHAYIGLLEQYFARHDLYAHLDYHIQGRTYGKGIIYMVVSLYSRVAIAHIDAIHDVKISGAFEKIDNYLRQISLENHRFMMAPHRHRLIAELRRLDDLPWQTLDSLQVINGQDVHPQDIILTESARTYRRDKLAVTIEARGRQLFVKNPEQLAVFHQFSWLLMHNYIAALCSRTGVYSAYDDFADNGSSAALKNTFFCDTTCGRLQDYADIVQQMTRLITQTDVLDRFVRQLQTNSYDNSDLSCPDDERIYQETGLFVGRQGWRSIASRTAMEHILDSCVITVRLRGRDRIVLPAGLQSDNR